MGNKASEAQPSGRVSPEERGIRPRANPEAPVSSGPAVVKVNKGRKLVAAGTAEDVEILMELEQPTENTEATETEATSESAATDVAATDATPAATEAKAAPKAAAKAPKKK